MFNVSIYGSRVKEDDSKWHCCMFIYSTFPVCVTPIQTHTHTQLTVHPWLWKHRQLAPHTPTPSTGRDNNSTSCGFEAQVPGPLSVPVSFVLTAGRKPSLARGHRALGSVRECVCLLVLVCVHVHLSIVWKCVEIFLLTEVTLIYSLGFPPLTFQCMNSCCSEGVERKWVRERAGEICDNFHLFFAVSSQNCCPHAWWREDE